jgi:hypothetical protein
VGRRGSREERVAGLIRVGELELTGDDKAEVDAYFAPDFVFHGPDGAELDYEGLKAFFASMRAAFDDLTISRGVIVVEGDYVACQTTIGGTIFRYDHRGRLAEEWVQTDNRSRLRQLGAEGR